MRSIMRSLVGGFRVRAAPLRAALLLLMVPALLAGCDTVRNMVGPNAEEARAVAKDAYIAGYPLIIGYGAMYRRNIDPASGQFIGGFNQLVTQNRMFTPADRNVNNPNNDVVVSNLQLDLRAEPMVLCFPSLTTSRYFSVQFIDLNMFNFGSVDTRKNSNAAGCVMVTGPRFAGVIPSGVRQILRSSSDFASAIYRTQITDAADLDLVLQLVSGYTLQPLSAFVTNTAQQPAAVPTVTWRRYTDAALTSDFIPTFSWLLEFAPIEDAALSARLGRIGIGPLAKKPYAEQSAEIKAAVEAGIADGAKAIAVRAAALDTRINGWQVAAPYGSRAEYKGDDLLRAAATQRAPFAPDPSDAMFIAVRSDASGALLDASARTYTLTFPAGSLPPVKAFWSISLYDARTHSFAENPLGRYLVNAAMSDAMNFNPDGSLTLHIQYAAPENRSNWLPAPAGPFELILRMYQPDDGRPSILPPGTGTWKPPALVPAA